MAKNKSTKVGQRERRTPTNDSTTAPEAMDIEEQDEENSQEELWDVIEVIQGTTDRICRMDGCNSAAVAVWKSSLVNDPDDVWLMCEPCQEEQFDGWPDDLERPTSNEGADGAEVSLAEGDLENETASKETKHGDAAPPNDHGAIAKDSAAPGDDQEQKEPDSDSDEANADDDDEEPVWDMTKIMSIAAVTHECPIKCSHESCSLPAAVVWVSNLKPTENWYSCLDCQEQDFGGWPDTDDLPVKHMTQEHMDSILAKCSKRKDVEMPEFPESPSKGSSEPALTNTITPPPNSGTFATQKNVPKGKSTITPSPAITELDKQTLDKKASNKPSKAQLEIHRKWQAAAEASGGQDARIVLSKPAAKEIIYDFLYDAFRPMNITEIHKGLKAIIPSPILKACLDDMALDTDASTQFADSDDDEEAPKKKSKKDDTAEAVPYKGSLSFKAGKGSNSSLYYTNYNTAKNGDGLDREEKNKLATDLAAAEAEEAALKQTLATMRSMTTKLLSEPFNEEATARLEKEEAELSDLQEELEAARKLKVNEKHKEQTKRRIENMATFWRKRRRICMDFLISMEEVTDGTISAKKCLAGDGQIELDSDEAVAKAAIEYAKKKRAGPKSLGGKKLSFAKTSATTSKSGSIPPSESFVAVLLDSQGCVQRVHLDDDGK